MPRKRQRPKKQRRIYIRLGDSKRDRYLIQWWDDMIADGRHPSGIVKMLVHEALTRTSALTGKPIAADLIEGRDRSADDEEDADNALKNIDF